jgi:type II secretory pathway pseudopilin PulG
VIVSTSTRKAAFTLVELLTVIAIIVLLIGILVPTLSNAKTQAKQAKTAVQISSIGSGCEMFRNEMERYPFSAGPNPFGAKPDVILSGAQWLATSLAGADRQGYVKPTRTNDTNNNGEVLNDPADWVAWYAGKGKWPRLGPYVTVTDSSCMPVSEWISRMGQPVPDDSDLLKTGTYDDSLWTNVKMPIFVDAFGYPILYYVADPTADKPFSKNKGPKREVGIYDYSDNAAFTGNEGGHGRNDRKQDGIDFAATGKTHPLGVFGYTDEKTEPKPNTFTGEVYSRSTFQSTVKNGKGRVAPHNPDKYLLISAGADGLFGTSDDIRNFNQ